MQDLSGLFAGGPFSAVVPTSQSATNQVFANDAMTAPGGNSVDVRPELVQAAPSVDVLAKPRSVVVDSNDAPSPVPWTSADGTPWKMAADDEYLPAKMMLVRGEWTEL